MRKDQLQDKRSRVKPIGRFELLEKMNADAPLLVDAQGPGWYEREHLPGALKADVKDIDDFVTRLPAALSDEIVVYCWSDTCESSARVSAELAARGYSNVRRYIEGKKDWLEAGLPIESAPKEEAQ